MAEAKTEHDYWRILTPEDLTEDFENYVKTLVEIEDAQPCVKNMIRHFWVKDVSLNENFITRYYNYTEKGLFEAREDDIYVLSFPKTGTTWLQQIVYLLINDCDIEQVKTGYLSEKFPFLEMKFTPEHLIFDVPSPRLLKSHLPYHLLPQSIIEKKCKMLYIARNPKDTIISYFHFAKMLQYFSYPGTLKEFVNYFIKGNPPFAPYHEHATNFWSRRHEPNILFLKYEDLQKDLAKEIRKVAEFLGKSPTDEQIEIVREQCTFQEMASNPSVNYSQFEEKGIIAGNKFFRKGTVAGWKDEFDDECNKIVEDYYNNFFKLKELEFDFEI